MEVLAGDGGLPKKGASTLGHLGRGRQRWLPWCVLAGLLSLGFVPACPACSTQSDVAEKQGRGAPASLGLWATSVKLPWSGNAGGRFIVEGVVVVVG